MEGTEKVVMEKKGLMAWVRKRRTTESSAPAAAAAATDDASPALPEHEGDQPGQAPGEGVRKFGRLRAILERIVGKRPSFWLAPRFMPKASTAVRMNSEYSSLTKIADDA